MKAFFFKYTMSLSSNLETDMICGECQEENSSPKDQVLALNDAEREKDSCETDNAAVAGETPLMSFTLDS